MRLPIVLSLALNTPSRLTLGHTTGLFIRPVSPAPCGPCRRYVVPDLSPMPTPDSKKYRHYRVAGLAKKLEPAC
jgi:hypothetical protein